MSKKPDFNRRRFVGVAAATVAAGPFALLGRVNAMTQVLTDVAQPTGSGQTEIRPFRFTASDADLTDLRRRINATRWPEREIVTDQSQGVQLATMQNLARYWGTQYDWRKCEARLALAPVVLRAPITREILHCRELHALQIGRASCRERV